MMTFQIDLKIAGEGVISLIQSIALNYAPRGRVALAKIFFDNFVENDQ